MMLIAGPADAGQNFKVYLGGNQLGWLKYEGREGDARLSSVFDNTPFGVFNGSYAGESRRRAGGTAYRGKSLSSSKDREVEIRSDSTGRMTEVAISPATDRTALSDAAVVPDAVLDPVAGFGRLIGQKTCPAAFQLYDGRRVVQVTPGKTTVSAGVTTCQMDYRVVQGRGHLSPLFIKDISMKMVFDPAVAAVGPSLLTLRSGIFVVEFRRD
jgi:hypothetical protein